MTDIDQQKEVEELYRKLEDVLMQEEDLLLNTSLAAFSMLVAHAIVSTSKDDPFAVAEAHAAFERALDRVVENMLAKRLAEAGD